MPTKLPSVIIIGRANVGKSTLFNRLTSSRQAMVSAIAGTTRDRKQARVAWSGKEFNLIDTGGLDIDAQDPIERKIAEQAFKGLASSDLALLVVDAKTGITGSDQKIASWLRRQKKQVIVVVNKSDTVRLRQQASEFYRLGLGEPQPLSAANGSGTGDLLDLIAQKVKVATADDHPTIRVAIIGKTNVGKSSLINALVHDDRVIVSDQPHTTRDSQDIELNYHGQSITLIDTAGITRSHHKQDPLKKMSMEQAFASIRKADVVVLMTEADKALTYQDRSLGDEIGHSSASVILVGNKWDLVGEKNVLVQKKLTNEYRHFFPWLAWAPLIFLSAKLKTKKTQLLNAILAVYVERTRYIDDNAADKFLKYMLKRHLPTKGKGTKHPFIYHFIQVDTAPPTFEIKLKYKTDLHSSYLKFLEKGLRFKFGFSGTPIKIYVTKTSNV
ncbi:MAG: ribosome biogenesis GTPase Der [Candidatus Komeilibacteria bacterium]